MLINLDIPQPSGENMEGVKDLQIDFCDFDLNALINKVNELVTTVKGCDDITALFPKHLKKKNNKTQSKSKEIKNKG